MRRRFINTELNRLLAYRYTPAFLFLIVLLTIWQFVVNLLALPIWLLPSPVQVAQALWQTKGLLLSHTGTTIIETTIGFGLSILLGFILGVTMDIFPLIKRMLYPFLIFSQTIPLIAIAPLLILWLGYGLLPKIITVVLVCFFPIAVNLVDGLEISDQDLLNLLKSMGATRWQIFWIVRWPHAMPSLFAGLKIAATYSVMAAVVGEWLGASAGLGVYLTRASHSFLADRVFASIIAISILSLLYFGIISVISKLVLPWANPKR